jgi:hypothetical protein
VWRGGIQTNTLDERGSIVACLHKDFWRHDWCRDCQYRQDEAVDRWLAEAPEREQRQRERLDSEGYYDDPVGWRKRQDQKRERMNK